MAGEPATTAIEPEGGNDHEARRAERARRAAERSRREGDKSFHEHVLKVRREHVVDACQPLVLIAQPTRSGGTLLSQLFDSHPELHVHPAELQIGMVWPALDPSEPHLSLFKALYERHLPRAYREGYAKDRPARKLGLHDQFVTLPFLLPPHLHRDLFLALAKDRPPSTQREVLDLYFTALFNAWLDNQNLYTGPKRWNVVFRGRLRRHLEEFFADYPDGRHIACVRDVKGVLASQFTRKEQPNEGHFRESVDSWTTEVEARLEALERYGPDRVLILTFSQLVTDTETTMRAVADWLGIAYDPILAEPTFNRLPIKANSSFEVTDFGVIRHPLDNWRQFFTQEEADMIDEDARAVYERVLTVSLNGTGARA